MTTTRCTAEAVAAPSLRAENHAMPANRVNKTIAAAIDHCRPSNLGITIMLQSNASDPFASRRSFLGAAAMGAAMLALPSTSSAQDAAQSTAAPSAAPKTYPLGLELYSVRGELAKDLPNTLKAVAKIGYRIVEFYAPYYQWTMPQAKEIKSQMDDLGLRCYSTHNNITALTAGDGIAKGIELNQILGSRYIILASAPATRGLDGWKKLGEQLTAAVETLKPHGLSAGFHNHQTEWRPIEGETRVMDVLAANTPKEFVLQLDVGTCMEAGADPIAWIKSNPGRIKIIHLKDWAPGSRADEKGYRVLFGEGVSPWKEICATAEAVGGVEYYLMEQEGSRLPEFETAQKCYDAWNKFRAQA
jgi:sugar phosphate isomerase/epimerase